MTYAGIAYSGVAITVCKCSPDLKSIQKAYAVKSQLQIPDIVIVGYLCPSAFPRQGQSELVTECMCLHAKKVFGIIYRLNGASFLPS